MAESSLFSRIQLADLSLPNGVSEMIDFNLPINCSEFWSEKFWLPSHEKWADFKGTHPSELVYALFVAFVLCFVRMFLYR